jgi:hypothetical protein
MDKSPEEIKEAILKGLNAPIIEALNHEGITPSRLAKKLNQILDSKEPKDFAFQGVIKDHVEYENTDAQLRAVDLSARLLDIYPAERHRLEGEIIEKRSPEEIAVLRDIARGVTETLRQNVKPSDDKG